MQQFDVFWKLLENVHENVDSVTGVSFYQLSEHLFMAGSKKRIPSDDNIVWCKNFWVIKDLSNGGSFFLFIVAKYFGSKLF